MGNFTIKQVMLLTRRHFPTRFNYRERDVLRRVVIKERYDINVNHPERPQKYFKIETFSYPQYGAYVRGSRGRNQRRIRHQYESILTLKELTLNNKIWKYRLGSYKKWVKKPPQKHIQSLYPETRRRFREKAQRRARTQQEAQAEYRRLVQRHKRSAKYLDVGDYNAQMLGINGDFIFRDAWALRYHGHLYGQMHPLRSAPERNPSNIPFFPKHGLALIEHLMKRGILKDE